MTLIKTLGFTTAIVAAIGLTTAPQPAHALGTGAAVGIGLGALAVGTAVGAATANPYYYGYPYGYGYGSGYYPSNYYYPPAAYPAYPANSCWSPYYGRYMPC
jgi:hypothetical protein